MRKKAFDPGEPFDALLDLDDDTPAMIVAKAHARARRAVAYYEGRRVRHV